MKQMFVRIALEATGRLAFGDNLRKQENIYMIPVSNKDIRADHTAYVKSIKWNRWIN